MDTDLFLNTHTMVPDPKQRKACIIGANQLMEYFLFNIFYFHKNLDSRHTYINVHHIIIKVCPEVLIHYENIIQVHWLLKNVIPKMKFSESHSVSNHRYLPSQTQHYIIYY